MSSEPKRYEPSTQCVEPSYQAQMIEPIVREVAWGNYVRYEDYARLKAEVARLTKAGDLMCRMAGNNQVINRHWKTAKGVQS